MDGPTIQAANDRALGTGATPPGILDALRGLDVGVPLVVMTYYNIAFRMGLERFAAVHLPIPAYRAASFPICRLEETGPWALRQPTPAELRPSCWPAPTTPDERLPIICERSRGLCVRSGFWGDRGALCVGLKCVHDR
jgi:tryptophan synthase alpha chain